MKNRSLHLLPNPIDRYCTSRLIGFSCLRSCWKLLHLFFWHVYSVVQFYKNDRIKRTAGFLARRNRSSLVDAIYRRHTTSLQPSRTVGPTQEVSDSFSSSQIILVFFGLDHQTCLTFHTIVWQQTSALQAFVGSVLQ